MPINLPQTFLDEEDVPVYFYQLDDVQKRCANTMLAAKSKLPLRDLTQQYLGSLLRTVSVTAPQNAIKACKGAVGAQFSMLQAVADFGFLSFQNANEFAEIDARREALHAVTSHAYLVSVLLARDVAAELFSSANYYLFGKLSGNGLSWILEAARGVRSGIATFGREFRKSLADYNQ